MHRRPTHLPRPPPCPDWERSGASTPIDLSGNVDAAITRCATDFAVGIAEAAIDGGLTAELVVLDHSIATHLATTH